MKSSKKKTSKTVKKTIFGIGITTFLLIIALAAAMDKLHFGVYNVG